MYVYVCVYVCMCVCVCVPNYMCMYVCTSVYSHGGHQTICPTNLCSPAITRYHTVLPAICAVSYKFTDRPRHFVLTQPEQDKVKKFPQFHVRPYFSNFVPNKVAVRLDAGWPWTGYVLACPRV